MLLKNNLKLATTQISVDLLQLIRGTVLPLGLPPASVNDALLKLQTLGVRSRT